MAPLHKLSLQSFKRVTRCLLPGCAKFEQQYPGKCIGLNGPVDDFFDGVAQLPLISIVIPSFNQGPYIESTILSVLDQNYPRLELLIMDGGSTDNTMEVISRYQSDITSWVSESDRGQTHAINKGLLAAKGDILAWLNSDDILLNSCLWRVAKTFLGDDEVDVIYGHRIIIDEEGKDIGKWILPKHNNRILAYADFVPQETLFWRREMWTRIGGRLDENFKFAMDWDLLLKFIDSGAKIERLNYFMGGFRRHDKQKTIVDIDKTGFEEMEQLRLRAAKKQLGLEKVPKYRMRLSILLFLIRTRIFEALWKIGLTKIG